MSSAGSALLQHPHTHTHGCVGIQELEKELAKELRWKGLHEAHELAATAQQVLRTHAAKILQHFWRTCLQKKLAASAESPKDAKGKGKKGSQEGRQGCWRQEGCGSWWQEGCCRQEDQEVKQESSLKQPPLCKIAAMLGTCSGVCTLYRHFALHSSLQEHQAQFCSSHVPSRYSGLLIIQ